MKNVNEYFKYSSFEQSVSFNGITFTSKTDDNIGVEFRLVSGAAVPTLAMKSYSGEEYYLQLFRAAMIQISATADGKGTFGASEVDREFWRKPATTLAHIHSAIFSMYSGCYGRKFDPDMKLPLNRMASRNLLDCFATYCSDWAIEHYE